MSQTECYDEYDTSKTIILRRNASSQVIHGMRTLELMATVSAQMSNNEINGSSIHLSLLFSNF